MADYGHYFDLLARAIARFKADTSEARQQIYERARRAQSLHLQNFDPMFSDSEIDRQRNALEEAIRRIEIAASEDPTIIEVWQTLLEPETDGVAESPNEDRSTRSFWRKSRAS